MDDIWDSEKVCSVCETPMRATHCWQCGGEGEFDDYEDDAINFSPGESFTRCDICGGSGVLEWCPQASKHPEGVTVAALEGE